MSDLSTMDFRFFYDHEALRWIDKQAVLPGRARRMFGEKSNPRDSFESASPFWKLVTYVPHASYGVTER
jgi:hypothetical protein